ncbi:UDP-N-acetylmuramoyl-L-alanine--D-glutamate ligase [Sphingomonas sp. LHG3406-1]|uniref:UDP-N-acetylmuramoyl-L-alanine--D-glutamate ligase n=1 Tax=Sphingomonas sp. LHG3406-1 TaxID=2804617 RepID=UPI00262E4698|nr:UDP-N-acetylmuramoyl-L-alanine--D-glutamate ligase [Sphingomonas sp. LHG3406-1]
MITARAWAGKHYAVYGLARSGQAAVRALLASGARVTAWDEKEEAREGLRTSLSRSNGEVAARSADGGASGAADGPSTTQPSAERSPSPSLRDGEVLEIAPLDDLTRFDSLVVSPGVPLNTHPLAARAREAGVEIIGDIELFARARAELPPHKVVGITGTNGKSTTTALVHHILDTAEIPTAMGGNIGLPILAQDPLQKGGVYVLELSSYQIDLTQSLDCDVAVLLNITPDHLDRYDSFEAYGRSKLRLFAMQSPGRPAVIGDPNGPEEDQIGNFLDDLVAEGRGLSEHQVLVDTVWDRGVSFSAGALYLDGRRVTPQADWPALQGPHNAWNACVAFVASQLAGADLGAIVEGLMSYPGLPHRMERVRELNGTLFVNDSKATNAEAAAPALAAYPRIRWIVGGQAKTKSLGQTADHLANVAHAYTIGEAGPMFADLLEARGVAVTRAETLENAVKCAAEDSLPGETVLLSPACASFDQFRDFEARGDAFRRIVGDL